MQRSNLLGLFSSMAAFAAIITASGVAEARCCSGFWRCAAAVATGGLSCAAQEAKEKIGEFVARVRNTSDEGKAAMQTTLNDLNRQASASCGEAHEAVAASHRSIKAERQRGEQAASQKPAQRSAPVERSMQQAKQKLAELEKESAASALQSGGELAKSSNTRRAAARGLNTAFQATFVAPLASLIAPLVAASDPVTAAATLVAAARTLQRIEGATGRLMQRGVDEFADKTKPHLDKLKGYSAEQAQRERQSQQIAAAMLKLRQRPTEENRRKLDALVNPSTQRPQLRVPKLARVTFKPNSAIVKQARAGVGRQLSADAAFAKKVKISKAFDRQLAQRTIQGEFDKRLAGKNLEQLRAEEKKLLREARAQYSKDAKTRKALEKLVKSEVAERAKKLKARAKPKPGLKPRVPIKTKPLPR